MRLFLCKVGSYSTAVVEHERAGASHCFEVGKEQHGVVQCHAKVHGTQGGQHCGGVNRDGGVFERAGLPWQEQQFRLVEIKPEVVGRHQS